MSDKRLLDLRLGCRRAKPLGEDGQPNVVFINSRDAIHLLLQAAANTPLADAVTSLLTDRDAVVSDDDAMPRRERFLSAAGNSFQPDCEFAAALQRLAIAVARARNDRTVESTDDAGQPVLVKHTAVCGVIRDDVLLLTEAALEKA